MSAKHFQSKEFLSEATIFRDPPSSLVFSLFANCLREDTLNLEFSLCNKRVCLIPGPFFFFFFNLSSIFFPWRTLIYADTSWYPCIPGRCRAPRAEPWDGAPQHDRPQLCLPHRLGWGAWRGDWRLSFTSVKTKHSVGRDLVQSLCVGREKSSHLLNLGKINILN